MKEVWKDIEGYHGLYEISNLGRVKTIGNSFNKKEKIRKCFLDPNGYVGIILCKNSKIKKLSLHRLIGIHFIPNPNNKPKINHMNGIKSDNRIENLEWSTQKENIRHAMDKLNFVPFKNVIKDYKKLSELMHTPEANAKRKLTLSKKEFIKVIVYCKKTGKLIGNYKSIKEAAIKLKSDYGNVCRCVNGIRYKSVNGYIFKKINLVN
jgi:hypothetical protein